MFPTQLQELVLFIISHVTNSGDHLESCGLLLHVYPTLILVLTFICSNPRFVLMDTLKDTCCLLNGPGMKKSDKCCQPEPTLLTFWTAEMVAKSFLSMRVYFLRKLDSTSCSCWLGRESERIPRIWGHTEPSGSRTKYVLGFEVIWVWPLVNEPGLHHEPDETKQAHSTPLTPQCTHPSSSPQICRAHPMCQAHLLQDDLSKDCK